MGVAPDSSVDAGLAMDRFGAMKLHRAGSVVLAVVLSGSVACEKPAPATRNDTTAPTTPPPAVPESIAPTAELPWDTVAGPLLLVVGQSASRASVVLPGRAPESPTDDDTRRAVAALRGRRFDLLGNGRVVGTATFGAVVPSEIPQDCSAWPTAELAAGDDSASRDWVVAFEAGRVTPASFDSLAGLSSRDSSQLAIEIARLASALPGDTVPELKGIPYQVRRAHRFMVAPGVQAVFAEVFRTLNQEASPKQEHVLMVAERDSTPRARYRVVYGERSAGGEETLESVELLAVAQGAGASDLVLARYVGDGVVYSLVERTSAGRWRLRWSSPYAGC